MCLIAFAIDAHPQHPLLIAANRDEFWHRPTLPLDTWQLPNGATVVSGRDLQAGGTWLGVTPGGRVAMLTNVRSGEPETAPRTRGELLVRWLAGPQATPDWQTLVEAVDPAVYGGFNLVLGDMAQGHWVWLSNRFNHPHPHTGHSHTQPLALPPGWQGAALGPGLYGVSNALLDTSWPKTDRLKAATRLALGALTQDDPPGQRHWQQPLLDTLLDLRQADNWQLPSTGVPPEREQQLSSAFVYAPGMGYGTRSSLIARWHDGRMEMDEWTHDTAAPTAPHANHWSLANSQHRRLVLPLHRS